MTAPDPRARTRVYLGPESGAARAVLREHGWKDTVREGGAVFAVGAWPGEPEEMQAALTRAGFGPRHLPPPSGT